MSSTGKEESTYDSPSWSPPDGGAPPHRLPPVPLHKRASSHFQPRDRHRGNEYYREGRVAFETDASRVRAQVRGSEPQPYRVGIDWSRVAAERVLHSYCDCQRFASGTPCKHLWALLLALAEEGGDAQPPGRDRLALRKDRFARWGDLEKAYGDRPRSAPAPRVSRHGPKKRGRGARGAAEPAWRGQLTAVREEVERLAEEDAEDDDRGVPRQLRFLVNAEETGDDGVILDVFGRHMGSGGKAGKLKRMNVPLDELPDVLFGPAEGEEDDRPPLVAALPASPPRPKGRGRRARGRRQASGVRRLQLPRELCGTVLPRLCSQRVLGWWDGRKLADPQPVSWDSGEPWQLALRLEPTGSGGLRLRGGLERHGKTVPLRDAILLLPAVTQNGSSEGAGTGLVLFPDALAGLESADRRDLPWIHLLRERGEVVIPPEDLEEALEELFQIPSLPPLEAPEELKLTEETSPMHPRLVLEQDPAPEGLNPPLLADLSFEYGDMRVSAADARPAVLEWDRRRYLRRDMDAEHRALVRLLELGMRPVAASQQGHALELPPEELPVVAEPLRSDGWSVEVRGISLRSPNPPALKVESGIDWFELSGEIDFDSGDRFELKRILEAIEKGDRFLELEDGSRGLLPASWMETYGSLSQLAQESDEDGLRFLPSQALLVDSLLSLMPEPDVDAAFAELRKKLKSFERIKAKKEPRGFQGTLRGYQRHGLGWLDFLREFGLGGVLADDMGLGKTVQVLALLRTHRTASRTTGLPYLVVAPRSLLYNWVDEASRFTPDLDVVEYHGPDRESLLETLGQRDLVVTTYGTLRRDIGHLAKVEFDTVILDEAQAIKNRQSQSAKAARLLVARHRLALTGTPIENHLGELGSLFEFLNPGLLGRLPWLDVLSSGRKASKKELELVAEGIRPFILRRTKSEVLKDLPPKTEQVLFCELEDQQRELYDQLRLGYQQSLLQQAEGGKSLSGSTIQVLEALLRLRQIACHPGLVKEEWETAGSAKLDALFEQVNEVLDEGHKVLVFSQFTSLLAFVRRRLDEQGATNYLYLDGQTRDRGELVERFQNDPEANLFLISLKAGGLGLNLTAAGYVFLLDPWWNPAVEAQAIDRAHRIGQNRPVFAYRLIARDTVEEKILELQRSKSKIAEAILEAEGTTLKDLTADDLRMLLS
ncbi:MAG: SNF2-related protein [Thermoanaerobaculia bacterium]|nr:SNF2-related protein [Thermoanaerobaculia bacterium]